MAEANPSAGRGTHLQARQEGSYSIPGQLIIRIFIFLFLLYYIIILYCIIRLVLFFVIRTVWHKSRASLEARFFVSSRRMAWLPIFQRTFICLSRRRWRWGSISRRTGRTRTLNSDSFWLRAESTDSLATTAPRESFPRTGNMSRQLPLLLSHKF